MAEGEVDGAAAGAGFMGRGAEAHPVKSKRQRTAALGVTSWLLAMARAGCFIIGKGLFCPAKVIPSSGCATGSAAAGLKPGTSGPGSTFGQGDRAGRRMTTDGTDGH